MNDEKLSNLLPKKFDEPLLSIEHFSVLKIILIVVEYPIQGLREYLSEIEQVIATPNGQTRV